METLPEMCSYGCGTCDRWTCESKEQYDACPRKETAERNKAIAAKFYKRHENIRILGNLLSDEEIENLIKKYNKKKAGK